MPGGQPSPIEQTIGYDDQDQPITVGQRIIEAMRVGSYLEPAAKRAGVHKDTVYAWLTTAGKLLRAARGEPIPEQYITDHEAACLRFSDQIDQAEAAWEINALTSLERLARGGIKAETTTTRTLADGTIETTVRVEHTLPSAQVLEWRLSRRFPQRYRHHVEVTGDVGLTLTDEERAADLCDTLDAYLQGAADVAAPKPSTNGHHENGSKP